MVRKTICVIIVIIFQMAQILPSDVCYSSGKTQEKALRNLNENQIGMYAANWVIQSVMNDNARNAATDNVTYYNELENNFTSELRQDEIDQLELKGPHGGAADVQEQEIATEDDILWEEISINNVQEIPEEIGEFLNKRGEDVYIDSSLMKIEILNGTYRLIWQERDADYKYSLRFKTFAGSGSGVNGMEYVLTEDGPVSYIYIEKIMNHSNGNISIIWRDTKSVIDESGYYPVYKDIDSLRIKTFDKNGEAVDAGSCSLTQNDLPKNAYVNRIVDLADGGFAVIWNEYYSYTSDALGIKVFDNEGKEAEEGVYYLTGDRAAQYVSVNEVKMLPEGGFAVIWEETSENGDELFGIKAFGSDGKEIEDGYRIFSGDGAPSDISIKSKIDLSNGNTVIIWEETKDGKRGLAVKVLDKSGKEIEDKACLLTNGLELRYVYIRERIELPSGGFVIFWEGTYQDNKKVLGIKTFDKDGKSIGDGSHILTEERHPDSTYTVQKGITSDGGYYIIWMEKDADGNSLLAMKTFDESGYPVKDGVDILTGERHPYEISVSYNTVLSNGNIALTWVETRRIYDYSDPQYDYWGDLYYNYTTEKSLMIKVFDKDWNETTAGTYDLTENRCPADVSSGYCQYKLSDGSFAYTWQEKSADGKWSLRIAVFDSSGNRLGSGSHLLTADTGTYSSSVRDVYLHSNGSISVVWEHSNYYYDSTNGGYNKTLRIKTFGGGMEGEEHVLTEDRHPSSLSIRKVAVLKGGAIAVIWEETVGGKKYLRMEMFDGEGNELDHDHLLTGDRSPTYYCLHDVLTLANGNLAILWNERDADYNLSLRIKVFSHNGEELKELEFTLNGDRLLYDCYIEKIVEHANGCLSIIWTENDRSYRSSLHFKVFDEYGAEVDGIQELLTGDRSPQYFSVQNIITHANGSISVIWQETDINYKRSLRVRIFDKDGEIKGGSEYALTDARILTGTSIMRIFTHSNGNISIVWEETVSSYEKSLRMRTFDRKGNEVEGGACVITADKIMRNVYIDRVVEFSGGKQAIMFRGEDSDMNDILGIKIFDNEGREVGSGTHFLAEGRNLYGVNIKRVVIMPGGGVAVIWNEAENYYNNVYSNYVYEYCLKMMVFDGNGVALDGGVFTLTDDRTPDNVNIRDVIELPGGNIAVIWDEATRHYTYEEYYYGYYVYNETLSLRMKVLNGNGSAIDGAEYLLTEDREPSSIYVRYDLLTYSYQNIALTWEDNIAIMWEESYGDGTKNLCMKTFNKNGIEVEEGVHVLTEGRAIDYINIEKAFLLAEGTVAVVWRERDDAGKECLVLKAFDKNGKGISEGSFILTEGRAPEYVYISEIKTLSNGSFAILWSESDENNIYSYRVKIFDKYGRQIGKASQVLSENTSQYSFTLRDIVVHSNGSVSVVWEHRNSHYDYDTRTYHKSLRIRTFAVDGTDEDGEECILTEAENGGPEYITVQDVFAGPEGNITLIWTEERSGKCYLKAKAFDKYGQGANNAEYMLTEDREPDYLNIQKIFTTQTGNFAIVWTENTSSYYDKRLMIKVFDAEGREIEKGVTILTGEKDMRDISIYTITSYSDGSISVIWGQSDNDYNRSIRIEEFSPDGKRVASESREYAYNYMSWHSDANDNRFIRIGSYSDSLKGDEIRIIRIFDEYTAPPPEIPKNDKPGRKKNKHEKENRHDRFDRDIIPFNVKTMFDNGLKGIAGQLAGTDTLNKSSLSPESMFGKGEWRDLQAGFAGDVITPGYDKIEEGFRESLERYTYINPGSEGSIGVATGDMEAILQELMGKENQTALDKNMVEAINAVIRDSNYMDEDVEREFKEAIYLVRMAETMKGILEGVDFEAVSGALIGLVGEQKRIYKMYITSSKETYELLEKILGLDLEKEAVPEKYLVLPEMDTQIKRKIVIDFVLEGIRKKDKKELAHKEIQALEIEKMSLEPLKGKYKDALKKALNDFSSRIRMTLQDIAAISVDKEEKSIKTLFLLDKDQANKR